MIPRPGPKSKWGLFLGLVGWYRRFVPNFSTLAAPLTTLIRKSVTRVIWNDECEHAFQVLKWQICQTPVLQSPDFTKQFLVQVDASGVGLGAVLAQGQSGEVRNCLTGRKSTLLCYCGKRGTGYKVGYWLIEILPFGKRVCVADWPQTFEVDALKAASECKNPALVHSPPSIPVHYTALSR